MQALIAQDREAFYDAEIAARERARLSAVRPAREPLVSGADKHATEGFARKLAARGAARPRRARARARRGAARAGARPPPLSPAGEIAARLRPVGLSARLARAARRSARATSSSTSTSIRRVFLYVVRRLAPRRQQHARRRREDQHIADDVRHGRPLAEHESRSRPRRSPARSARRARRSSPARADDPEPQEIGEPRADEPGNRSARGSPARAPATGAASLRRTAGKPHDHECDEHLPRRVDDRVAGDARPFHIDGAGGPAHRDADREQQADQRALLRRAARSGWPCRRRTGRARSRARA